MDGSTVQALLNTALVQAIEQVPTNYMNPMRAAQHIIKLKELLEIKL